MLSATIRDVKKGIEWDGNRYRIYMIKAGDILLYVGKSKEALSRMESHVGKGAWVGFFGSDLDIMLCENAANDYVVEFISEADIEEHIKTPWDMDDKVSWLEEYFIYELSPVYNAMGQKKSKENVDKWFSLHQSQ